MIDTILFQLENRIKAMKALIDGYRVAQPYFLVTSTEVELRNEADKFGQRFSDDVSPPFKLQLLSIRSPFRPKLEHLTNVNQFIKLLLIKLVP